MVGELVDRSASRCMRMFCGRGCAWVYVWIPTKMINKYWLNGFREMNKKLSSAACFSRLGASAVFHIGIFFYADANKFPNFQHLRMCVQLCGMLKAHLTYLVRKLTSWRVPLSTLIKLPRKFKARH